MYALKMHPQICEISDEMQGMSLEMHEQLKEHADLDCDG